MKTHSPMFYVHWTLAAGARAELPAEYPERAAYVEEGRSRVVRFRTPDDGLSTLTFLKDEAGEYVKARLVTASLQLDIVGTKRK